MASDWVMLVIAELLNHIIEISFGVFLVNRYTFLFHNIIGCVGSFDITIKQVGF